MTIREPRPTYTIDKARRLRDDGYTLPAAARELGVDAAILQTHFPVWVSARSDAQRRAELRRRKVMQGYSECGSPAWWAENAHPYVDAVIAWMESRRKGHDE